MGSFFARVSLLAVLVFAVSLPLWAHGHGLETSEDRQTSLDALETYLDSVFVEVGQSDLGTNSWPVVFVGKDNKRYRVERTHLAEVLGRNLERVNHLLEEDHSNCQHHDHHDKGFLKKVAGGLLGMIAGVFKTGLRESTVKLSGRMAEIASDYGMLPLFVIAATWPPYTVVTEMLESVPMGPAHIFCHVSQFFYWTGIHFVIWHSKHFVNSALERGSGVRLAEKIKSHIPTHFRYSKMAKMTGRALLESAPLVFNHFSWKRYFEQEGGVEKRLLAYGESSPNLLLEASLARDVDQVSDQPEPSLRLQKVGEITEGLRILRGLVSLEIAILSQENKIEFKRMIRARMLAGKINRAVEDYFSSLLILTKAPADSPRLSAQKMWAKAVMSKLLNSMNELHKAVRRSEDLDSTKALVDEVLQLNRDFRRGNLAFDSCQGSLATAAKSN